MPDPHFITTELDRRIALAQGAHKQGSVDARAANAALMPWAAAEAWLVGHQGDAISPRDGISRPGDLCSLDDTIAELNRARDHVGNILESKGGIERLRRWIGLRSAVRDLERLRSLREGFRQMRQAPPATPAPMPSAKPPLPPAQPSLLADMFGADGKPLPINRRAA
jgi:hypothetical protein